MTITEAELAQMKAQAEILAEEWPHFAGWFNTEKANHFYKVHIPRLIREVGELTRERDDLKADYLRRHKDACDRAEKVEELRAALREIGDMPHPATHINPYKMQAIARAALGEG